jgi:protein required for attachment to host cells
MATTWIVAADASRARILQVADRERLVEVDNLVNPDARLQNREIDTDARTRFPGGNTSDPEVDAVEHRNELFAKRVADYLESARNDQRYEQLVLVAAPKMLGQLRQERQGSEEAGAGRGPQGPVLVQRAGARTLLRER